MEAFVATNEEQFNVINLTFAYEGNYDPIFENVSYPDDVITEFSGYLDRIREMY